MKEIIVYYGPKKGFKRIIPSKNKTLSEFITEDDAKRKEIIIKQQKQDEEYIEVVKSHIDILVAYSESYAGITEGAVQGFISILSGYDIDYLYLQNPPIQIRQQFEQAFPKIIKIEKYKYKILNKQTFLKINNTFSEKIIGQEKAKRRILISLYPLINKSKDSKPVVIMFYGASGVGKTETAKFISNVLGQKLFRKQFSMFHSEEFSGYLFGGNHSQACFAKDLLERESNVILLDEFDKAAPVFHSAFYQLFDEGVFEDKNYNVLLYNAIIICTSNYKTEDEIRKHLGDPIFYRFDKFIEFENLSAESVQKIIDIVIDGKCNKLNIKEKKQVEIEKIRQIMQSYASKINNVRQINNIVEEFIGKELVEKLLAENTTFK